MGMTAPMVPSFSSSSSCQPFYLYGLLPQTGVSVCVQTCGSQNVSVYRSKKPVCVCVCVCKYTCVVVTNPMGSQELVCGEF